MERLSNYAALSTEVLPEFLQVEAFSKLNNAIGKVNLVFWTYRIEMYFHLVSLYNSDVEKEKLV